MYFISAIWQRLTQKALTQSTGKLETAFFESTYRIMYATGFSLSDNRSISYKIYSHIVMAMIVAFISSELWYLFGVSYSLDVVIDNVNVTIIHLIVLYRYKKVTEYKHVYNKLAKSMESSWFDVSTPERKKVLEFWLNKSNKYFRLLLNLAYITLGVWYVHPLVDDKEYNLVAAVRLPVEYRTPHRYIVAYLVVLLFFHYTSFFVVVNDLMMQTYLIHLLCQFAVLSHCFENILPDCGVGFRDHGARLYLNARFRQKYLKRLGFLVEQHKYILSISSELRKVLSKPMLGQLAASGMLICLAGYQVTATSTTSIAKFLMSLLYLSYNLFIFYLLCRWCDEIKFQSENIREAVYFSGWEDGMARVPGVRTRLMLVIARASRPLVLTAGGLYDISLNSYTTLVKTSYSALTVLLRMRQR